jgi:hypothetical protein
MRQVKTNKLAHLGAGCIMSAECYTLRENGGAAHVSAAWHVVLYSTGRRGTPMGNQERVPAHGIVVGVERGTLIVYVGGFGLLGNGGLSILSKKKHAYSELLQERHV